MHGCGRIRISEVATRAHSAILLLRAVSGQPRPRVSAPSTSRLTTAYGLPVDQATGRDTALRRSKVTDNAQNVRPERRRDVDCRRAPNGAYAPSAAVIADA